MYIRFDVLIEGEKHPISVAVQVLGCSKGYAKIYWLASIDIYGEDEIYTLGSIEYVKDKPLLNYSYGNKCNSSDRITNISFSESISDFML